MMPMNYAMNFEKSRTKAFESFALEASSNSFSVGNNQPVIGLDQEKPGAMYLILVIAAPT